MKEIERLHCRYDFINIFPTDDSQLERLEEIYEKISSYCFVPFNSISLLSDLDKSRQYDACERLGIPYPRSCVVTSELDFYKLDKLSFPLLFKPTKRHDLLSLAFRSLYIQNSVELGRNLNKLQGCFRNNVSLLVSEFIPGDDSNIFAYTAYRSKRGIILNEWAGKKLTQYPDEFGVFSSASNSAPYVVSDQGRALVQGMNLYGIVEPEFKYDSRDCKYKLMEINLRSMMWHRTGNLSGVYLHYTQWLDGMGRDVRRWDQQREKLVHFVYMKHELTNLLTRRHYWNKFFHNVFGGQAVGFAVFDIKDLKPFFVDLVMFPRMLVGRWLRILLKR